MTSDHQSFSAELDAAIAAALAGGAIVKDFYDRASAQTYQKGDGSPVTDADLAADRAIREIIAARFPDDAILTEEGKDDGARLGRSRCWIVDPVDGTEQFILRTGEFDVLVALIVDGRPAAVAGYQPTTRTLVTASLGGGAWVRIGDGRPEQVTFTPTLGKPRLATSKWFGAPENEAILTGVTRRLGIGPSPITSTGFSPRMFLSPRAFDAMVGVRAGDNQTMASEWDFAAPDLVISEAGGRTTDLSGQPYLYNKPVPTNDGGLVASADRSTHAAVLRAVQEELSERGIALT